MKVALLGAGVANSLVASEIAKIDGVEVICLERVTSLERSDSGTGLNISPNAMQALKVSLEARYYDVLDIGYPWRTWDIFDTYGNILQRFELADYASIPGIRVRWSDLYRRLRASANQSILYGAEVCSIGYANGSESRVWVEFQIDGKRRRLENFDLVICGEGRFSKTRASVCGTPTQTRFDIVVGRLLLPSPGEQLISDYTQWFAGPNRLLAFSVPESLAYIVVTMPIPMSTPARSLKRAEIDWPTVFNPEGLTMAPACEWIVNQLLQNQGDLHWARFQEINTVFSDGRRVMFIGDASHAMTPTLGQGASQAIEDACTLASIFRQMQDSLGQENSVGNLIEKFALARRERVGFVKQFSMDAADTLLPGADPVAGAIQKGQKPFQSALKQLFGNPTFVPNQ